MFVLVIPLLCVLTVSTIRSLEGLHPVELGRVTTPAQIVSDPQRDASGTGVVVRIRVKGKHLRATAYGTMATAVLRRSAGEEVIVVGRIKGWTTEPPSWAVARHLSGSMSITDIRLVGRGAWWSRQANWIRGHMQQGARTLPDPQRSLFLGFVLGDNRDQPVEVADDFRLSGLSHLLVVSGQNVAFVLAAAEPILSRGRRHGRLLGSLAVLVLFGVVTRWEPSVLRAGCMAALTLGTRHVDRRQPALRVLSLSVIVLLIVDPLLSRSFGFGLSVAATAGLALLSGPIDRQLSRVKVDRRRSLPLVVRRPLAATLAAQIGAFPLLVLLGGSHPVSIVANLIALPASEPVMIWGVIVGVPAGVLGEPASTVLHAPSLLLLSWVAFVARSGSTLARWWWVPWWWPVGLLCVGGTTLARQRLRIPSGRVFHILGALIIMIPLGFAAAQPPCGVIDQDLAGSGFTLHRVGGRTIVSMSGRVSPAHALRALRDARVTRIDVLVVSRSSTTTWRSLAPIRARLPIGLIMVPGRTPNPPRLGDIGLIGVGEADHASIEVDHSVVGSVLCADRRCTFTPGARDP